MRWTRTARVRFLAPRLVLVAAAGMAGLGLELSRLRGLGMRPLVLGFASWMVIAVVSLALVTWV